MSPLQFLNRYLVKPVRAMHEARRAYLELMALDERQLADIGLRRSEIARAFTAPREMAPPRDAAAIAIPLNSNDRARRVA
ncbi:MAG: DUF1127 domain-containing protein [Alphaproteobacteria bacterium]|nr:DUF1127 domain-containing protein [Alphaproteobacteria bacterium]